MADRWKRWEIDYLHEHAGDGAEAIAKRLGRTKEAVEVQASRYRVTLRKTWHCPRCGRQVFKPLSTRTGWCDRCTLAESRDSAAIRNREMRKEVERQEQEIKRMTRERQKLYSDTHRLKRRKQRNARELRRLRESRKVDEKSKGAEE